MFQRWEEVWAEAASLIGAEVTTSGVIRGKLNGYSFIVSASRELTLNRATRSIVCRVELPDLPGGVSIVSKRAWVRRWYPVRRRFVVFEDPLWDSAFAVRADNHQAAAAYLKADRRRGVIQVTMDTSKGENWYQSHRVLWRLDPAVRGLEVHTLSAPSSPHEITKGVRAAVALAEVLDPSKDTQDNGT